MLHGPNAVVVYGGPAALGGQGLTGESVSRRYGAQKLIVREGKG
jgi:hypothetical protein